MIILLIRVIWQTCQCLIQAAKALRQAGFAVQALDALQRAQDNAKARSDVERISRLFVAWKADQINRMPDEVLLEIFTDMQDSLAVARLQTVCSRWYRLICQSRSLWRIFRINERSQIAFEPTRRSRLENLEPCLRLAKLAQKSDHSLSWIQISHHAGLSWSRLVPHLRPSCSTISRFEMSCEDPLLYISALQFAQTCVKLRCLNVEGPPGCHHERFDTFLFASGSFLTNTFDVFMVSPLPNFSLFDTRLLSTLRRARSLRWKCRDGWKGMVDEEARQMKSWIWKLISIACGHLQYLEIDIPALGESPPCLAIELSLLEVLDVRGVFNDEFARSVNSMITAPHLLTYKSRECKIDEVLVRSAGSTLQTIAIRGIASEDLQWSKSALSACHAVSCAQVTGASKNFMSYLGEEAAGLAAYPFPKLQHLELRIAHEVVRPEDEITGGAIVEVICKRQGISRSKIHKKPTTAFSTGATRAHLNQSEASTSVQMGARMAVAHLQTLDIIDEGGTLAQDSLQALASIIPNFVYRSSP